MFATVRDKDGKVVRDLAKEDFSLLEDGRPQTIQYFSRQSDLPLTLGLLVDTSMSERRMLGTERDASYSFLEKVLRPGSDKAFLIHFDHDVELLQDLTSSRERLEKALALLDRPSWKDDNGSQGGGNGGGNPNGNWGAVDAADMAGTEAVLTAEVPLSMMRFILPPMTCSKSKRGARL